MVVKIPNFRRVGGTNLYRCGSPETGEVDDFIQLRDREGIRAIVDLRRPLERTAVATSKIVDFYQPCGNSGAASDPGPDPQVGQTHTGKIFNVNLMNTKEIQREILSAVPWYMLIVVLFLSIVKWVTGKDHVSQLCLGYAMNKFGNEGLYTSIVDNSGEAVNTALKLVSEQRHVPCLVCCSIGKDRTGVITALVLSVLGFSKDFIAEDYSKSAEGLREYRNKIKKGLLEMGITDPDRLLTAEKSTMLSLLEYIGVKYGSVAAYLESIGFNSADQARLRLAMTATAPPGSEETRL